MPSLFDEIDTAAKQGTAARTGPLFDAIDAAGKQHAAATAGGLTLGETLRAAGSGIADAANNWGQAMFDDQAEQQKIDTIAANNIGRAATTNLLSLPRATGTPENDARFPQPWDAPTSEVTYLPPAQARAAYNVAAENAENLSSPAALTVMAGTAGLGSLAAGGSTAAKLALGGVGVGFGAEAALDTVKLTKEAQRVLADPEATAQQKSEATLRPVFSGLFGAAMLAGGARITAGVAVPKLNAAYPELFWQKAGLSADQFAAEYPEAVRRVAANQGAPEDVALVQQINAAAKASGVSLGDLARGRIVAENIEWQPRATQQLLPEELRPTEPPGGMAFREAEAVPGAETLNAQRSTLNAQVPEAAGPARTLSLMEQIDLAAKETEPVAAANEKIGNAEPAAVGEMTGEQLSNTYGEIMDSPEYTPAVRTADGQIFKAPENDRTHSGVIGALQDSADSMAQDVPGSKTRGFVTGDGQFLTLMEIARREMAKKAGAEPVPATPADALKQFNVATRDAQDRAASVMQAWADARRPRTAEWAQRLGMDQKMISAFDPGAVDSQAWRAATYKVAQTFAPEKTDLVKHGEVLARINNLQRMMTEPLRGVTAQMREGMARELAQKQSEATKFSAAPQDAEPAEPTAPVQQALPATPPPAPAAPLVVQAPESIHNWLSVPEPDVSVQMERAKAARITHDALNKDLQQINDGLKQITPQVTYRTGPYRGRIKDSAPRGLMKQYNDLVLKKQQLGQTMAEISTRARGDVAEAENAGLRKTINNPKEPMIRRLGARLRLYQNTVQTVGPEFNELASLFNSEAAKEVRKRYPDATDDEVKAMSRGVEKNSTGDLDSAFRLDPELQMVPLRAEKLVKVLSGIKGIDWRERSLDLYDQIKSYLPNFRDYNEPATGAKEISTKQLNELTGKIRREETRIRGVMEQEEAAAATLAEKAAAAARLTKVVTEKGIRIETSVPLRQQVSTLATKQKLEVQKQFLERTVMTLIAEAPSVNAEREELIQHPGKVHIEVPGDGSFTLFNFKETLTKFNDEIVRGYGRGLKWSKPSLKTVAKLTPKELAQHEHGPTEEESFKKDVANAQKKGLTGTAAEVAAVESKIAWLEKWGARSTDPKAKVGDVWGYGDQIGKLDQKLADLKLKAAEEAAQKRRGTSSIGMPTPPPGTAMGLHAHGFMPVTMPRIMPGSIGVQEVYTALENVMRAVGLETPIRHGRMGQSNALGFFKTWSEVIRTKQQYDIPTAAHEVAHAFSKKVFGSVMSKALMRAVPFHPIQKELQALGKALYGASRPVAGYTAEGFSELVRLWLTTEDAPRKAPQATAWLENTLLQNNTDLGAAMRAARDKIDLWRGQGAMERMKQQTAKEPGVVKKAGDLARSALSKRVLFEEFAPLEELAAGYEKITGRPLPTGEDPNLIAQAYRRTAGAVLKQWVEDGVTDIAGIKVGPSLREAYARLKPSDEGPFHTYLFAKQALIRLNQGKFAGIERADAEWIIQQLETPAYIDAADKIAQWWQAVRDYKRDAYPEMNGAMIDAIEKGNPVYYGPLAADLDPAKIRQVAADRLGGGLYRFKGHGGPTKRMYEQSLLVAENIIGSAQRDLVLRSVVRLSKQEGMGWLVEKVPVTTVMQQLNIEKIRQQLEGMGLDTSSIPPDELLEFATQLDAPAGSDPIIAVREQNGVNPDGSPRMQARWYQVPRYVQEVLQGVHEPERLGFAFELFVGMPTRTFKLGTTGLRAGFSLVTNPLRDAQTFAQQSIESNPAWKAKAVFNAYKSLLTEAFGGNPGPYLAMFHQMGISGSSFVGGDIAHAKREARGLFHGKIFKVVASPLEAIREGLSFNESAFRVAELELAARHFGWTPGQPVTLEQAVQLRLAAKRVTTDFSAKGAMPAFMLRGGAGPFFNAGMQGARAFSRTWRENQGTFRRNRPILMGLLNALTLVTGTAILNWAANRDKEWYRMLPWRERYLYLNIEHGNQVIQIPLPQEWGVAFAVMPVAVLDSWYRHDPRAVNEAMKHAFAVLNPADWPVPIAALVEQKSNHVEFFNQPIIPKSEIDLVPGAQRGPYTSWVAKQLGDAFPNTISPRRVDAAIREAFGGAGADYSRTPEKIMELLGLKAVQREAELSDVPVVGKLFRHGGTFSAANQALNDFWDDQQRYGAALDTTRSAVRNGTQPVIPLNEKELAYGYILTANAPYMSITLRVANLTPNLEARQKLYQGAAEMAQKLTSLRPPPSKGLPPKP